MAQLLFNFLIIYFVNKGFLKPWSVNMDNARDIYIYIYIYIILNAIYIYIYIELNDFENKVDMKVDEANKMGVCACSFRSF